MEPVSLGFRTDLMMLGLQGGEITDRGGYLVVRTPGQPTFHWGNFLLFADPPEADDLDRWESAFRTELPEARHMTFGIDTIDGTTGDLGGFIAEGFASELSVVLGARAVHEPPRPNRDAQLRMLTSDADWSRAVELQLADVDPGVSEEDRRSFLERRSAAIRALQGAGHGAWFGAFVGGRMVSGLGVFTDGGGTARFQSVVTHPGFRGRGLAGTLVHLAGRYALAELGAEMLVIVGGVDDQASRIYRSAGFTDREIQVQLARSSPRS